MPSSPVPGDLVAFLARPNPAVIGTLRPDGAPHTVATWYLWEDGRVLVNMDASRARLDHIREDPRVALTVLDGENWYQHVSLRGSVAALEDDGDFSDIDRLSRHYGGRPYPNHDDPRISAWIEVASWHRWMV
jgi:PPOX class probable F420-dependent enzyme